MSIRDWFILGVVLLVVFAPIYIPVVILWQMQQDPAPTDTDTSWFGD